MSLKAVKGDKVVIVKAEPEFTGDYKNGDILSVNDTWFNDFAEMGIDVILPDGYEISLYDYEFDVMKKEESE